MASARLLFGLGLCLLAVPAAVAGSLSAPAEPPHREAAPNNMPGVPLGVQSDIRRLQRAAKGMQEKADDVRMKADDMRSRNHDAEADDLDDRASDLEQRARMLEDEAEDLGRKAGATSRPGSRGDQ